MHALSTHTPTDDDRLVIRSAGVSDAGGRAANEDAYLIARTGPAVDPMDSNLADVSPTLPQDHLFAVADGMGGHRGGRIASRAAIRTLADQALDLAGLEVERVPDRLETLVEDCRVAVLDTSDAPDAGRAPGTTLTLLLTTDGVANIAHVGDSRCYLLRDGSLALLTHDHTVGAALRASPSTSRHIPRPSQADSMLTSALGGGVDEPAVQVVQLELRKGDRLLLCTDGLYGALDDPSIRDLLLDGTDPEATSWRLYGAAMDAGADDNITAIVADVVHPDAVPEIVSGVFDDAQTARHALQLLQNAHFTKHQISLLGRDADRVEQVPVVTDHPVERGAALGGSVGAVVGGLGGLLAGVGAIPIGLGLVAAGPILAGLQAGLAGAGLGALAGALGSLGYVGDTVRLTEAELDQGKVWVGVHCSRPERARAARAALELAAS